MSISNATGIVFEYKSIFTPASAKEWLANPKNRFKSYKVLANGNIEANCEFLEPIKRPVKGTVKSYEGVRSYKFNAATFKAKGKTPTFSTTPATERVWVAEHFFNGVRVPGMHVNRAVTPTVTAR